MSQPEIDDSSQGRSQQGSRITELQVSGNKLAQTLYENYTVPTIICEAAGAIEAPNKHTPYAQRHSSATAATLHPKNKWEAAFKVDPPAFLASLTSRYPGEQNYHANTSTVWPCSWEDSSRELPPDCSATEADIEFEDGEEEDEEDERCGHQYAAAAPDTPALERQETVALQQRKISVLRRALHKTGSNFQDIAISQKISSHGYDNVTERLCGSPEISFQETPVSMVNGQRGWFTCAPSFTPCAEISSCPSLDNFFLLSDEEKASLRTSSEPTKMDDNSLPKSYESVSPLKVDRLVRISMQVGSEGRLISTKESPPEYHSEVTSDDYHSSRSAQEIMGTLALLPTSLSGSVPPKYGGCRQLTQPLLTPAHRNSSELAKKIAHYFHSFSSPFRTLLSQLPRTAGSSTTTPTTALAIPIPSTTFDRLSFKRYRNVSTQATALYASSKFQSRRNLMTPTNFASHGQRWRHRASGPRTRNYESCSSQHKKTQHNSSVGSKGGKNSDTCEDLPMIACLQTKKDSQSSDSEGRKKSTTYLSASSWANVSQSVLPSEQMRNLAEGMNITSSRHKVARSRRHSKRTGGLWAKTLRKGSRQIFPKSGIDASLDCWKKVVAFCEVHEYDVRRLHDDLINQNISCEFLGGIGGGAQSILQFRVCDLTVSFQMSEIQIQSGTAPKDSTHQFDVFSDKNIFAFVLENGVAIIWGVEDFSQKADRLMIPLLSKYSDVPLLSECKSRLHMTYCHVNELPPDFPVPISRVKRDILYLKTDTRDEKLAVSLALAQSLRLSVYEEAVEDTIKKFGKLPLRIAANEFYKTLNYGTSETLNIRKWVAEVYQLILDVNIVEDFLDVPEYFWEDDSHQSYWRRVHRYLDVENRVQILNIRIGYLQEILKVISSERVEAQEFHLAWCVIILLLLNVVAIIIRETLD